MFFEIYRDRSGKPRFRAVGGNGEIFGDDYDSPAAAERGAHDLYEAVIADYFARLKAGTVHLDWGRGEHLNAVVFDDDSEIFRHVSS